MGNNRNLKIVMCDICDILMQQKAVNHKRHDGCRVEYHRRYQKQKMDRRRGTIRGIIDGKERETLRYAGLQIDRNKGIGNNRARRKCLRCQGYFDSESVANRLCLVCKKINHRHSIECTGTIRRGSTLGKRGES